jgi:integrase
MCRIGELKTLKWGNIDDRKVKDPKTGERVQRLILSVDGKTGKRQVVCQPYAAKLFSDWKRTCEEFNIPTGTKDLVFKHPEGTNHGKDKKGEVIETTNVAFKGVLDKLGIGTDADGKQRTVYSIRHTAISQALRRNVSLNAISKNAGVSIETLTRAYDHTQSSDYIMELTKYDYTGFDSLTR